MKRFSILIATVCVALSGSAQGTIEISGELSSSLRIPLLGTPLLIQTEDEAIRDLALRKRAPNLTIGSHPYFRGPSTEAGMVDFRGGRVLPVITGGIIQFFPAISLIETGVFRTFPLLEIEVEAIFEPAPSPTFQFHDLVNQRTSLEHIAFDPTGPGERVLHTHSGLGEFGALTLNGSGSALTVTTVPEPGTCALLGLASLAGWFIHRRRP